MSSAGRVPGSPRRSWRDAQSGADDPRTARQVRRVVWSLVGAALVACFAWFAFRTIGPQPVTYVAAAAVTEYKLTAAPPLAFARQSLGALNDIDSIQALPGGEGATSEAQLTAWLDSLKGPQLRDDDVLIVYLAAHGVSVNDREGHAKAYLLASNYDPPKNNPRPLGVVDFDVVLAALSACRAATKLLVLDAGSVERDWALGAVVNEFPQLLADKMRQVAEGNDAQTGKPAGVWVLSSHDLFEKSHAAFAQDDRQCVFTHFVAQGLSGLADKNGDGVDLAELYRYVRERVGRYVWQASGGRETQTPQLLGLAISGDRALAAAANVRLVGRATRREETAAAKDGLELKEEPKADKPPPTARLRSARPLAMIYAGEAPAANAQKPPTEKASDAKGDATRTTAADGDAESKGKPTAMPAANDANAPAADDAVAKPPAEKADDQKPDDPFLALLSEQWTKCHELADRSSQVWTTIDYAPHRWLQSVEKLKGYELRWLRGVSSDPKQLAGLAGDLDQELRRLRQSASDLPLALDRAQQHQQLFRAVQLRNDLLARLRYYLESPLVVGPDAANIEAVLDGLPRLLGLLRGPSDASGTTVAADIWLADLQAACLKLQGPMNALENSFTARLDAGDPTTIEAVLEFPWIDADQRLKLLTTLKAALPLAAKPTENEIVPRPSAWKRAAQLARWQAKWLQLAGTTDDGLQKLLARLGGASSDQAELRQVGGRLATLRGSLAAGLIDGDDAAARADIANRLRLLDGRIEIAAELETDPILRDRLPKLDLPWTLKLVRLNKGSPVELAADDELPLQWRIDADPPRAVKARWKVTNYNPSQLVLDATQGTLELTGGRDQTLALKVQAAKGAETAAKLTLELEAGERTQRDTIELRVKPLEPVEFSVDAAGPDGTQELVAGDPLRRILRPIAAGRTTFRLSLKNPSRRPREVEYRLLAFTAAGFLPADLEGRLPTIDDVLPRGMKELHSQTLSLGADEKKPLPLAAPAQPASDAKNAPAASPASNELPKGQPPPGQPLEALVVEIRESAPGTTRHYWIAFEPLHPRRYLRPVARYNFEKRLVEIDFSPLDAGWLPPEGSAIDWGYGEGTLVPPQRQLHASISPPKDLGDRPLEVFVAADGYPRAFRYGIRCDGPRGTQLPKDDFDLRLLSPPAGRRVWLKKGQPATVSLAADFPKERSAGKGNAVRVEIQAETGQTQPPLELRGDRRATFVMVAEADEGALALETTVDELDVRFPTDAYQDQDLQVLATLGNRQVSCSFTLDTRPPTIELDRVPIAAEGQELRVALRAIDERGGVKKVELALDPDDTGEWKMPVTAQPVAGGGEVWEAILPTNDKKSYRAGAVSQFLAKATDEAGNSPERPQRFQFRVVAEAPKSAMPAVDKKADLKVTVTFEGAPADRVDVTVSGPKNWQGKTDGKGQFTLRALPAGVYKIHIQGHGRASTPIESEHELKFDPAAGPVQSETLVSKARRRQ